MAPTIELIESITLSSSAANVTFSNIPQDYDDLLLVMSIRTARASPFTIEGIDIWFNSDTTSGNYTKRRLLGQGSSASSDTGGSLLAPTNGATSSTFSNNEVYVPNYAGASNKSYSVTSAAEHNSTTAYLAAGAELWSDTSAITSIQLVPAANNLVTGSSFELYGIKDADDGAEGYFGPAAQGGDEVYTTGDGYKVHVFKTSGTLNVTAPGEVEYLVIGGGGGGGSGSSGGGGGGAGGYRSSTGENSGGGSVSERPLNLIPGTYTVAIGAGGTGKTSTVGLGLSGSNSTLHSITSIGGGFGSYGANNGGSGGSGGGAGRDDTSNTARSGGAATSNQGYSGGNCVADSLNQSGAGGGGAGSVGSNAAGVSTGGAGGSGVSSSITGSSITRAGGGGGAGFYLALGTSGPGIGGSGGGGNGGAANSGMVNTGSGGGGGGGSAGGGGRQDGGNGGSGIVIIRYRI